MRLSWAQLSSLSRNLRTASTHLRDLLGVPSIPLSVLVTKLLNSTHVDTGPWECHTSFTIPCVRITGKDSSSVSHSPESSADPQQPVPLDAHPPPGSTFPSPVESRGLIVDETGIPFPAAEGLRSLPCFAATLLPSPGQREPHHRLCYCRERGKSPKTPNPWAGSPPGWLCPLPARRDTAEPLQRHRWQHTDLPSAPLSICFARVNMHVFRLSAKFEDYVSENLALSQDFLDLKPSLYELVLFSRSSENSWDFFFPLFSVDVSFKIKWKITQGK